MVYVQQAIDLSAQIATQPRTSWEIPNACGDTSALTTGRAAHFQRTLWVAPKIEYSPWSLRRRSRCQRMHSIYRSDLSYFAPYKLQCLDGGDRQRAIGFSRKQLNFTAAYRNFRSSSEIPAVEIPRLQYLCMAGLRGSCPPTKSLLGIENRFDVL
jgi:hypothetical protein